MFSLYVFSLEHNMDIHFETNETNCVERRRTRKEVLGHHRRFTIGRYKRQRNIYEDFYAHSMAANYAV